MAVTNQVTGQTELVAGYAAENEIIKAEDVTYGFDAGLSNLAVALRVLAGAVEDENFIVGGEVSAAGGMTVSIAPILAELYSTNECVVSTAATSVTLDDADSSGDRVDVISVRPLGEGADEETRATNDPISGSMSYVSTYTRKIISLDVLVTKGTAGNVSASSISSGYIKIAEVYVAAGVTEITDDVIYGVTSREAGVANDNWTADTASTYSIATQAAGFLAFLEEHGEDGSHGEKVIKASNINFGTGKDAVKASVIPTGKAEEVRGTSYVATAPVTALLEALAEHVDALYPYANDLLGRYTVASVSASYATTAAITLSGAQTIDGGAVTDGAVVLVKDQSDAVANGLYTVSSSGAWSRHTSFASGTSAFDGVVVLVSKGSTNAGKGFYTNDSATVGTDELVFSEITLAASRLTVDSVGSSVKPVYFEDGVPVAASKTVGDVSTPVYVATGTITACTGVATSSDVSDLSDRVDTLEGGTIGSVDAGDVNQPVYLKAGVIKAISDTQGSTTQPVYLKAGVITAMSGALSTSHGGTGATSLSSVTVGAATLASTATTDENTSDALYPVGVTSSATTDLQRDTAITMAGGTITAELEGNASTATTLKTARTIRTNLASTSAASFNGSANITPGVTGVLPVANGGTGESSLSDVTVGAAETATSATTAETATTATKLGTTDVGDSSTPIYLAAGVATECTAITASTAETATTATKLGSDTVGGVTVPVYLSSGSPTACLTGGATYYGVGAGNTSKVSNSTGVGYRALYNSTGYFNTALGYYALYYNTTGYNNTAVGSNAISANTTGYENTALGQSALYRNTEGSTNIAMGQSALAANTVGNNNIAIGGYSGRYQTNLVTSSETTTDDDGNETTTYTYDTSIGYRNTLIGAYSGYGSGGTSYSHDNAVVGYQALYTANTDTTSGAGSYNAIVGSYAMYGNTSGAQNVAVGYMAGYTNTTGSGSVAVGSCALYANTADGAVAMGYYAAYNSTGSGNTALGYEALYTNTSGGYNTAVGYASGYNQGVSSSWGYYNTFIGAYAGYGYDADGGTSYRYGCTAVGYQALYTANTTASTGYYNTALGYYALRSNTTGNYNTALGTWALYYNTTGNYNTALGTRALYYNTTGGYNTALGVSAGYNIKTGSYNIAIGYEPKRATSSSTSAGYAEVADSATDFQIALGFLKGLYFPTGTDYDTIFGVISTFVPEDYQSGAIGAYGADYIGRVYNSGSAIKTYTNESNSVITITDGSNTTLEYGLYLVFVNRAYIY